MRFQLEYKILPSKTIRDFCLIAKTKKEAEDELQNKYKGNRIKILSVEKV